MSEKKNKFKLLLEIYITFFKLGCFSFGGGYAAIPLIEREVIDEKRWLDREKIVDVFAVAQSLPGAIVLNASAFVSYSIAGMWGAVLALLGNLTPPLFIVLALSVFFKIFGSNPVVQAAFYGIRPAVVGLIFYAAYKMGRTAIKDNAGIVIMMVAFLGLLFFNEFLHPVIVIICGAIAGITLTSLKKGLMNNEEDKNS